MRYSDFAIEENRKWLSETAMKESTPKRYAGHLFEAAEQIAQLRADLRKAQGEQRASKGQRTSEEEKQLICALCGGRLGCDNCTYKKEIKPILEKNEKHNTSQS